MTAELIAGQQAIYQAQLEILAKLDPDHPLVSAPSLDAPPHLHKAWSAWKTDAFIWWGR